MTQKTQVKKLNIKPVIDKVLKVLSDRNRTIVSLRHGIALDGKRQTLESIGQKYGITRERVRQIEEAAYAKIRNTQEFALLDPTFSEIRKFLEEHYGVVGEDYLFNSLVSRGQYPYLRFSLALNNEFEQIKENDEYRASWALNKDHLRIAKNKLDNAVKTLSQSKNALTHKELVQLLFEDTQNMDVDKCGLLHVSKKITQGPFENWGLKSWSEISPKGVRDKIYLVILKEGKPMHFRKLAEQVDKSPFQDLAKRKTHPQTVHNELIKDSRFVLVGRGIYALGEWGYIPGTVKDVIINVLQRSGKALEKEDLVSKVLAQRIVQKNTVLLNLQNKKYFRKEGTQYYLA